MKAVESLDSDSEDVSGQLEMGELLRLLERRNPPVREIRAILRLIHRGELPDCPSNQLARLLLLPDDDIQRMAALQILGSGSPDHPAALIQYVDRAALEAIRWVVERVPRPVHDRLLPVARALFRRPEFFAGQLAAELVSRFRPDLAEHTLLDWIAAPRAHSVALHSQLEALGRVGSLASAACLARYRNDMDPDLSRTAGNAFEAVRSRLLASARPEEELEFIREGLRFAPDDLELRLREALTLGVYLDQPANALASLERERARLLPGDWGEGERRLAELLLGQGLILFFDGDPGEAASRLDAALRRIGRPTGHRKSAAILRARIRLVAGLIAATGASADDTLAREHFRSAIAEAPYSTDTCPFDQAMLGVFGPLVALDRLRRTGRVTAQLRFYELLEEELWSDSPGVSLGIRERRTEQEPETGSDEATVESERVKSWIPWWRLRALQNAGELRQARSVGERVVYRLRGTNIWDNRDLAAQCSLWVGRIHALEGRPEPAREAYREALAVFEEIDHAFSREDLEARPGRFPPGSPPYRPPYRSLRAQVLVAQSELSHAFDNLPGQAFETARDATRIAPQNDRALIAVSLSEARTSDRRRALKVLEMLPRRAGLLFDLSRLAEALEQPELSDRLFETHLSWNALTPERRRIDQDWRRRLRQQ